MTNETATKKACRYCGQMVICGEDERPEMICTCAMALAEQAQEEITEKLMMQLEDMYGENCREKYPEFAPVSEEQYALLAQLVDAVGHLKMGSVTTLLTDGSKCKITVKDIARSKTITRKAGV